MHAPPYLRPSARGAAGLLLCATAAFATSCSSPKSDTPAAAADAGSHPDATGDAFDASADTAQSHPDATSDSATPDSSSDAPAVVDANPSDGPEPTDAPANPITELGACLGMSQPITVSGQMPYVSVPVGSLSGEFVLDFASTFSSIDMKAFPSTPVTMSCDPTMLWQICTVPGFAFFGPAASVTLTTEDFSGITGSVRQAGIVGTDFLSENVFTVAYGAGLAFAATSAGFCSSAAMVQAGFAPLSTTGFYENDLSKLVPFMSVDSLASAGTTVPDVPTVPVQIAGATALAQLDTGFNDAATKFSVNINEAFLLAIQAKSPAALVRDPSLDEVLTTCVNGVSEPVQGYRLAAGASFGFVDQGGAIGRSYASAAIFVKETPDAAQSCGGIGTWTVPAAQVGASFYVDMGILAFDPFHETVWIPTH